jgi:murein DD-endopeptidase MepM/ murein hydrolase activator NlpD
MSKKRKKNSRQKQHKSKKQQSLSWFEKMKAKVSFDPIKTFFIELMNKTKAFSFSSMINRSRNYLVSNKKGVIFTVAMTAVVAIGYFGFVYNGQEPAPVVSVDLSSEQTSFMEDVEDEIGDIQTVNLDLTETSEEETEPELTQTLAVVEPLEEAIQPPVDVITSADITGVKEATVMTNNNSPFDSVSQSMMIGVDMYAIVVDSKEVAYFDSVDAAELVLDELRAMYTAEDAVEERIMFSESVEVLKVKRDIFDVEPYKTNEEILEYIVKGTNEQRIHKVVKGDNFWDIAEANDLNVGELMDANPGIDEKRLQIGTELSLIVSDPLINVVAIQVVERIDPVPYGRGANVLTDKYYEGEYKTKQAGVPGEAEVTVEVYSQNGKLIGEKVLEQNIIKEPVEQIVYQGTKPAPPRIGTGTYQNPTSRGYITSRFGARSLGYHYGIDVGIPSGTDVYAADGGVVTYAGYKGTYGKLIIINHGANTETRYAHLSSFKVSSGESVHKGQLIAFSGNTGRSTGPHLHFEVRINNNPLNPLKYVNYR